ncbi:MAG: mechanosensitive ion channel family protein [Nitrososphaerales archaeon]
MIIVAAVIIAYVIHYYTYVQQVIPAGFDLPVFAVITLVAGYVIIRIISAIIWRITAPKLGVTRGHGAKNFFEIVAAIFLAAVVFGLFGFNLTNWLVGAGFLGIVLGLAAQQVLGNIFAGVAMLFARPFDIGDRITLISPAYGIIGPSYNHETLYPGYTGIVKDIGIFYTRIHQDEGVPAVLPNSVVIGSLILNHTRVVERTVRVRMDLDKSTNYRDFRNELLGALKDKEVIVPERTRVEIVDVGVSTYQVAIMIWTRSSLEEPVKTLMIQSAMDAQTALLKRKSASA